MNTALAPRLCAIVAVISLSMSACSPAPPRYSYSKGLAGVSTATGDMSEADRDAFAQARQYEYGNGVQANPYKARDLYEQLAAKGLVQAKQALGDLYEWRLGDQQRAVYWYKQAADAGDCLSAADLDFMYSHGIVLGSRGDIPEVYARTGSCSAGQALRYNLEIKTAVDAQKHYPGSAVRDKKVGIPFVEFDYKGGGHAYNAKIYRSSGNPDLDAAAIASVTSATLPEPPSGIQVATHFVVGLNFNFG